MISKKNVIYLLLITFFGKNLYLYWGLKMKKIALSLLVSSLFLSACPSYEGPERNFYPQVYNMKELNTEFDDYNPASLPIRYTYSPISQDILFLYSTNYSSQGKNFDIEKGTLSFYGNPVILGQSDPSRKFNAKKHGGFLAGIGNTDSNEYGPNILFNPVNKKGKAFLPLPLQVPENVTNEKFIENLVSKKDEDILGNNIYTFSSDRKDNQQDIYIYTNKDGLKEFLGNDDKSDEKYLTYDYEENVLYFSSNREGKYHIYKYENKENNLELDKLLTDKSLASKVVKVEELNSNSNDNCPYVLGDLILFASDREGGKGGYDLYYSKRENGKWSKPDNLQNLVDNYYKNNGVDLKNFKSYNIDYFVNTEEDEFRPTLISNPYSKNYELFKKDGLYPDSADVKNKFSSILFSSKRKTGKGGFDLHFGLIPIQFKSSIYDQKPIISSINIDPEKISKNESFKFEIIASDPEGGDLKYDWSAKIGTLYDGGGHLDSKYEWSSKRGSYYTWSKIGTETFTSNNTNSTSWNILNKEGSFEVGKSELEIRCKISDDYGNSTSVYIYLDLDFDGNFTIKDTYIDEVKQKLVEETKE